jgi:selenocysteine lyase/cysteine desulfurase
VNLAWKCTRNLALERNVIDRTRRRLLALTGSGIAAHALGAESFTLPSSQQEPSVLAGDESYWQAVAGFYDSNTGIINLEHGYWGKMARPVQEAYVGYTRMVNTELSWYARRDYGADHARNNARVAAALGVAPEEIVLTRNATEAIHNLIRQYTGLKPDAAVLYSDIDYPAFKTAMQWLGDSSGREAIRLDLPARADQAMLLELYVKAMDAAPNLQLMLLTHVSNQHGLTLPVREIAAEAKKRGIDVICDCAQSWGLLDFKLDELGVDWAGFNLHKWIGSPVGVGALYMRKGTFDKIAPYPGEQDPDNTRAATRIHTATANFAAVLSLEHALDFHDAVGGANKEARLRYLKGLWTGPASAMAHIEVPGALDDDSNTGMGAFRLKGQATVAEVNTLQKRLETEFGIFTVVRDGLASGACIRVTPQVFTTPAEIRTFVAALHALA